MPLVARQLPSTIFRYVFTLSWPHQIALVILTIVTFLARNRTARNSAPGRQQPRQGKTLSAGYDSVRRLCRRRSGSRRDQARSERLSKLGRGKRNTGSAPARACLFEDRSDRRAG